MIEVNLLQKKKKSRGVHQVLGLDLAQVNFKLLIIAVAVNVILGKLFPPIWEKELEVLEQKITQMNQEMKKIRSENKKHDKIQEELNSFNMKIKELEERSKQIDEIIKLKVNPKLLLEKIARVIPNDMWIKEIIIDESKKITIRGGSFSYKSISTFLVDLNETLFFNQSLVLGDSKTVNETMFNQDVRIEEFEIKGAIASFSPWAK